MRSLVSALIFSLFGVRVVAQTLTLTFPSGPTIVQVFTTDANGHFTKATIATLSGSTPPTPSPYSGTSTSSTFASTTGDAGSTPNLTGSSTPPKAKGIPAGVIAGILVAVVVLIAVALALFFVRRKKQRHRRGRVKVEIDPVGSPVVDKSFMPDPFVTDIQARGMGYDISQQPTRRLEAKFLSIDQRGSSESQSSHNHNYARVTPAPRITVTREGETTGRPITPSSSEHHGTHSLTGHTPSTHYALDVKSARGPSAAPGASRNSPREESSLNSTTSSQTEMAVRMRDLLTQMEQHVVSPVSDSEAAIVQLRRQVEMLRRENDELRLTGAEAPPAYEGDGRF